MAISNPPAYLQAGTYTASLDRLNLVSCRFVPTTVNNSDVAARGGVLPGGAGRQFNFSMTNWDVTVGKGAAVVENTFTSQGGDYTALNPASQVLTVTASSPTTNRIDIIGVRIQDAFYSGALNQGDLAVVQGTPTAGTPADPTLPSTFLPIVRVTVNAATSTGTLTDLRKRTSIAGATYFPFTPQLTDSGTVVGETQMLVAAGAYPARLRVWDGTAWRGITSLSFDNPAQTGSGALAAGGDLIVASLSVADPGFGYKLRVGGGLEWVIPTATSPNLLMCAAINLDSTSFGTNEQIRAYMTSASVGGSFTQPSVAVPEVSTVAQSGAHTVRLIAHNFSGIGFSVPAAGAATKLSVELVPT